MLFGRALHALQRRMIWLLIATYVIGALLPRLGVAMRNVTAGTLHTPGGGAIALSLPTFMLGFLLFAAGFGTSIGELRHTLRRRGLLLAAVATNAVYPIAFTVFASAGLAVWHDIDEAQTILVGLALIGAMPIAGSSTAWSQNADGNISLSIGLVVVSMILSPLLTPLALHAIGAVTHGDYSEDLHELAEQGSSAFIVVAVVVPTIAGVALHAVLGKERAKRVLPFLKALNLVDLLLLNYSNAATVLPGVARERDWDFLALAIAIASAMCAGAFAVGAGMGRLFGADRPDRTSLLYGLGMNNNGTGLVLASTALADHPLVLLPIILYNLVQQVAAAIVDRRLRVARGD